MCWIEFESKSEQNIETIDAVDFVPAWSTSCQFYSTTISCEREKPRKLTKINPKSYFVFQVVNHFVNSLISTGEIKTIFFSISQNFESNSKSKYECNNKSVTEKYRKWNNNLFLCKNRGHKDWHFGKWNSEKINLATTKNEMKMELLCVTNNDEIFTENGKKCWDVYEWHTHTHKQTHNKTKVQIKLRRCAIIIESATRNMGKPTKNLFKCVLNLWFVIRCETYSLRSPLFHANSFRNEMCNFPTATTVCNDFLWQRRRRRRQRPRLTLTLLQCVAVMCVQAASSSLFSLCLVQFHFTYSRMSWHNVHNAWWLHDDFSSVQQTNSHTISFIRTNEPTNERYNSVHDLNDVVVVVEMHFSSLQQQQSNEENIRYETTSK